MSCIEWKQIYKKAEGKPWQVHEGESLVLSPQNHEAHELNETATFIWKAMDGESNLKTILDQMMSEYDVNEDRAKKDIHLYVEQLIKGRLIELQS